MIQTAIIAFLLIGAMFIFTECGNNETKEVASIEVDKEGIPKYVTEKSHDKSYSERDSEMAAASYIKQEKEEENLISSTISKEKYSLATKEGEGSHNTGTSAKTRDDEIALASYGTKGTLETEETKEDTVEATVVVEETVITEVEPEKEAVIKEIPVDEKAPVEEVIVIEKTEVIETPKVAAVATAVVAVAASTVKLEDAEVPVEVEKVVEVETVVPLASDIVVPEANMTVVTAEPVAETKTEQEIIIPAIPSVPELNVTVPTALKSKSMEEFASNSQVKKDLNVERTAKEEVIAKNALLAKQLEEKIENEKLLKSKNQELGMKIDELLLIAEEATKRAEAEDKESKHELQSLISIKESLEANLTAELENEKKLKETNDELSVKITELLAIAENGTAQAEAEHNATVAKMQGLLSTKESLEANMTKLKATNDELSVKITELLAIAEEGTAQAEAEHNATVTKMQGLLSTKEGLEANVTKLKATNDELAGKISELLSIAEEGTQKAQEAYEAEQQEIQGLLSTKESLEANLTAEQENEKRLTEENIELQAKIAELLNIAKEGTEKATAEQEAEKEELKALLLTKESLEENVTKLKATNDELAGKISELLSIAEEGTQKAQAAYESEKQEIQGLLSIKESLETNLTAELENEKQLKEEMQKLLSAKESLEANLTAKEEHEKLLAEENIGLNAKISELLTIAKEATEKATAEQEQKNQEFQGLLSTKESLEANLTAELESEKLLSEENAKLKEQLALLLEEKAAAEKAEAERVAAEEAAKAEAEAKAKEEAERLAAQKAAEEKAAAEKAEAEAKAAAEKAEAERVAAEEAAKAEAEAKAKEEAERLAAEKEAEEKAAAEKAEAEAKAKEAEKKLADAFSLTNVKFKTGSMQLTTESKKRLNEAASVMKNYEGYSYKIQGHTDNRGNESFNITLSGKRAEAVKAYLISQGVDAGILSTEGFGSAQPIASNDTREGRVQNRRVVFEIIK